MSRNKPILTATVILFLLALLFYFVNLHVLKDALLITITIICGFPIAKNAWQSTRMKTFSIELLIIIASIGALIIGEYLESAVVTFLFLFGAYLEAHTLEKTRSSLKSLLDILPREATVYRDEKLITLLADEVSVGDHVVIHSGDKIAVDGKIVSGNAIINEAPITGESVLISKSVNNKVYSGSIVDHGYIEVIAEKVGMDTAFSKIIVLVEEAQETKAQTQKYLEKFASFYTPAILLLSIIIFLVTTDINMTLTFLVISCPGALVISAPVSIVAGIGNGAKKGVLIKGGDIMEKLSKVNVIFFDKTGTLTKGKPEVTDIQPYGFSEEHLLKMAAEAESMSEHPLGQAIVKKALNRGISVTNKPENFEVAKGLGIKAVLKGEKLILGSRQWLKINGIQIDSDVKAHAKLQEEKGCTLVYAALGPYIIGVISIADEIRSGIKESLQMLKNRGISRLVMLTGDNESAALKIGEQLGFDEVYANLLPEDKVKKIKEYRDQGCNVAMIGDGINDAPALAKADVGIAMGGFGTDLTMETANVVLMSDKLDKLPQIIQLSKATVRNMKQNMFFAVSTVIFLVAGVLTKHIFLASGMFVHEISVLIVILNAVRLVNYGSLKENKHHVDSPLNLGLDA